MTDSLLLFDCVLAVGLVSVAIGMLSGQDLFRAIVLFILFGLLLTVAWCRLDAVDIALAEAGIGAGLTGALLLNTWAATVWESRSRIRKTAGQEHPIDRDNRKGPPSSGVSLFSGGISTALWLVPWMLAFGAMIAMVVPLALATDTPIIATDQAIPDSGVTHPVTAVLLNFRAYDTLLEVVVLMAAALAVLPLIESKLGAAPVSPDRNSPKAGWAPKVLTSLRLGFKNNTDRAVKNGVVLETFTKLMIPVAVLVAGYILWAGKQAPGGAFQSAALLCAIGVLLLVSGQRSPQWTRLHWRVLMSIGLCVFLLVGLVGSMEGRVFLEYPTAWAGSLILIVEFCLTVSLTVILISLFTSTSPTGDGLEPDSDSSGNQNLLPANSSKEGES